ncbi:hypothetical protein LBW59_24295 [Ralstonia solanacearum]|uniref:Uncharacterized protein n=1 Tax=Ralstonia solanacearum TaxID=305 RepID=A0AAW5ZXA0_RALSL|nr:hypothetical protein [Ralstonia solanacearum]MDB0573868.1 hypothetical protein [Ralstonia solanacearum]
MPLPIADREKKMKTDDVKLDPRKFDNDMLEESWGRTTDDEVFELSYELEQPIPESSPAYPAWVAWLRRNHPGDDPHR